MSASIARSHLQKSARAVFLVEQYRARSCLVSEPMAVTQERRGGSALARRTFMLSSMSWAATTPRSPAAGSRATLRKMGAASSKRLCSKYARAFA